MNISKFTQSTGDDTRSFEITVKNSDGLIINIV